MHVNGNQSSMQPDHDGWVKSTFAERRCVKYVADDQNTTHCLCGQTREQHIDNNNHREENIQEDDNEWNPITHTISQPTDAFGSIKFSDGLHPNEAQYIRLAYNSSSDDIFQLLTKRWGHVQPKLVISVHGDSSEVQLNSQLKRILHKGLVGTAKIAESWILSKGINTCHIDEALRMVRNPNFQGRPVVSIGVAPWGRIRNRTSLIGVKEAVNYQPNDDPCTDSVSFSNGHDCFLLADDGTVGRYGAEIHLRRNLEKFLSTQNLTSRTKCYIPVVSLIVGGDIDTIGTVYDNVTKSPSIPVVVLADSGGAANLITSAHELSMTKLQEKHQKLLNDIEDALKYDQTAAENVLAQLLQCVENKNLITIYNLDKMNVLDRILLRALLRARQLSAAEQLDFALEWKRLDVLDDDIAMETLIEALVDNRIDVVKLLLDKGLPVNKLLTKTWLEKLYKSEKDPIEALRFIIPTTCSRQRVSLKDVDLAINKYMGGAYRSKYFVKNNSPENASRIFPQPFNELLVWSVLTKRHSMAKLMWEYGDEALAKAVIAHNLYRAMAIEAKDDDALELEKAELNNYSAEFGQKAYELLDYCFRQDNVRAQELLTNEMPNWSYKTCLCLAFMGHHCQLLAHPCAQLVLGEHWIGGLRTRRQIKRKILLVLVLPFFLPLLMFPIPFVPHWISCLLEFRSKEEIEQMDMQQAVDKFTREGNYSCKRPSIKKRVSDVESGVLEQKQPLLSYPQSVRRNVAKTDSGWKKKLIIIYTAPVTKYLSWSMAYFAFLLIFTYTLLIRTPPFPEWNEWYVIVYLATFAVEKIREIVASEPVKFKHKLVVWVLNRWNFLDALSILVFFTGLILRLQKDTLDTGRVFYCLNIVYWYIRILVVLRVSKFLGPFLTMINRMLEKMIQYIILILIVLMSYGVFRQSLLFPHEEFSWHLVRDIFYKPYFMIYGELFVEEIDPPCGSGSDSSSESECVTGHWLNPLLMVVYLSIVCVLMLNLLIAVFNSIFDRVAENSERIWKFNRYAVVMEYQKKPALPPPLVIVSHIYLTYKWFDRRKIRFVYKDLENQLFAFLKLDRIDAAHQYLTTKADFTAQYQFEKKAMEGLNSERPATTTAENVRLLSELLKSLNLSPPIRNDDPNAQACVNNLESPESRLKNMVISIEPKLSSSQQSK